MSPKTGGRGDQGVGGRVTRCIAGDHRQAALEAVKVHQAEIEAVL